MGKYKPFINLGPGDTIREELEHYGWEQKDLAEIMGRSKKSINQLINNRVAVTYETAEQLAAIFKQSTQFWLNLEANYRQRLQDNAKVAETEAKALIYRYMPISDLRKVMDIPLKTAELIDAVKKFWGIKELDFTFLEEQSVYLRKSDAYDNFNPFYALTWLQFARRNLKGHRPKAKYKRNRLESLAENLSAYTVKENGVNEFLDELKRCGVVFLQADHFRQTYTDGATFFDRGRPVVVYTARHNRLDNFWFTMAHELGHILLHADDQTGLFIDSLDHLDRSNEREKAADNFAAEKLKTAQILAAFADMERSSAARIKKVAHELGLHPGIIAGCLQHHGKAAWSSFHDLKPEIRTVLEEVA